MYKQARQNEAINDLRGNNKKKVNNSTLKGAIYKNKSGKLVIKK
jgi:hypothetical protein